jgi:RNA recognition motif-containing protein
VGDLSNEVNDEVLLQAFSAFGSVSEARVMWDMKTGRSRGYGFVAFRERADAEKALSSMDGEWLGSRAIRCNWANQKGQPSISQQQAMAAMGMTPTAPFGHHHFPTHGVQSYDMVVQQTPQWQTTCYVGNLTPYTTQNDLVPLFQNFGYVVETRFQADRGFAFIKMDTHENAAMAICQLNGYSVNGRPLKCSVSSPGPVCLTCLLIISMFCLTFVFWAHAVGQRSSANRPIRRLFSSAGCRTWIQCGYYAILSAVWRACWTHDSARLVDQFFPRGRLHLDTIEPCR